MVQNGLNTDSVLHFDGLISTCDDDYTVLHGHREDDPHGGGHKNK